MTEDEAKAAYDKATTPGPTNLSGIVDNKIHAFMVDHSEDLNELFAAMAKSQGEMQEAIKTSENKFFDSMYADYADIWRVAQKPNANNNLTVMHFPLEDDGRAGCMSWVGHSSGQWMSSTLMLPVPQSSKGDRPTTNYVAVISYAKRINMQSICNIAADEDNDLQGVEQVPITEDQATKLYERIMALEEDEKAGARKVASFCKKFGIEAVGNLTEAQFKDADEAIKKLEAKQ